MLEQSISLLKTLRETSPLIYHLTNTVTINDCANISLAIGGSPLMSFCEDELQDIIPLSSSIVLNIGTMEENMQHMIFRVGELANQYQKPIVLDIVGIGASTSRKNLILNLLKKCKIEIIKGNMAEIKSLLNLDTISKGVDSLDDDNGTQFVKKLSKKYNCITVITGKIDYIGDNKDVYKVYNGNPLMKKVTGTGCMITSLIANFLAVGSPLEASIMGVLTMGVAGERSCRNFCGTGTLRINIIDEISKLTEEIIRNEAKLKPFSLPNGIYGITDSNLVSKENFLYSIEELLKGGIKIIQYREKNKSKDEMLQDLFHIKKLTEKYGAILIINDHIEIAKIIGAHGVHLGQLDCNLKKARDLLGEEAIIGISTSNIDEIKKAILEGADYIGVGPIFKTSTKLDTPPLVTEETLKYLNNIKIPFTFIGGIKKDNITTLLKYKNKSFAIISELLKSKNIRNTVLEINNIINK